MAANQVRICESFDPGEAVRIGPYGVIDTRKINVEFGATIPLLQSVQTVVRKKTLSYAKYANGWILANTMDWS